MQFFEAVSILYGHGKAISAASSELRRARGKGARKRARRALTRAVRARKDAERGATRGGI